MKRAMKTLYQKFETLLQNTPIRFKRYLYDEISWESRMTGIIGARGVGKTTLILQYIKEKLDSKKTLYISADDLYFGENRLIDLADEFYKIPKTLSPVRNRCLFVEANHE